MVLHGRKLMPSVAADGDPLTKIRVHQGILVDFARMSADATDLERLLDLACHHAARAVGVAHSKVMQARHDKADLLIVAGRGWAPGVVGHARLAIDMRSPAGRAYQTREVVGIGNLAADPEFRMSQVLREHSIASVLNAPIAIDGVVWGVLEVDATEPDRFDEDDERFILGMALVLALAVDTHQGHEQRARSTEECGRKWLQMDTLLREQNHRMRNYFQLMLSVLANRRRKSADEQIRREYDEVMERVTAIALAHDQLTSGRASQTHVNAATYIDALCLSLERTVEGELRIDRQAEAVQLRADRAVPMGLILNELLMNAIKHAAKAHEGVAVMVRFESKNSGTEAILVVSDDGPGMGEVRTGSMGLKLIEMLTGQLSGRLNINTSSNGTTVEMHFPLLE
jgi:two-component system, sensor histidine kinase PdtaS